MYSSHQVSFPFAQPAFFWESSCFTPTVPCSPPPPLQCTILKREKMFSITSEAVFLLKTVCDGE